MKSVLRLVVLPAIPGIPAMAQTPAGVSACNAAQLSVTGDRKESEELGAGLGHQAMTMEVRNRSSSSCALEGTMLVFTDRTNRVWPAWFCANCVDYLFSRQPVRRITLAPSRTAYVVVGYPSECRNALT